jgi:RNA-directed DNA polymerase
MPTPQEFFDFGFVGLGFKTIIKPSAAAIKSQIENIAATIDAHQAAPQAALISRLNPMIKGWSNYTSG